MVKTNQNTKGKKRAPVGKADAPLVERVKALQDRILAYPPTGKEADKEFFDWLSGDE